MLFPHPNSFRNCFAHRRLIERMWRFVEETEKGGEKQRMCAMICELVFTSDTVSFADVHEPLLSFADSVMEEKRRR